MTPAARNAKHDKSSDFFGCSGCRKLIVVEKGNKPVGWKEVNDKWYCSEYNSISDTIDQGLSVIHNSAVTMWLLREEFDEGDSNSGSHKPTV